MPFGEHGIVVGLGPEAISKSAGCGHMLGTSPLEASAGLETRDSAGLETRDSAGLETCDSAGLETCATTLLTALAAR